MPKINQEEYELLKSLDDKWKWIARDKNRPYVEIFQVEPHKAGEVWMWFGFSEIEQIRDKDLFQFIQWEDESPYNIAELIKEYENSAEHVSHVVNERVKALGKAWSESEETKLTPQKVITEKINELKTEIEEYDKHFVKRAKEWSDSEHELEKQRIKHSLESRMDHNNDLKAQTEILEEALDAVNQLDDPEITIHEAHDKIREESSLTDRSFDYYWNCIADGVEMNETKPLDNFKVLSPEWIDEHVAYAREYNIGHYVQVEHLQNLLVPKESLGISQKLEKVQIPQFVADYIEMYKEQYDLFTALLDVRNKNNKHANRVAKWLLDNLGDTEEPLAELWLNDSYEVEEEQKYYLKIGNLYLTEPLGDMTSDIVRTTRDKGVAYQFTDEKSIAIHLVKFEGTEAVKVEELK